MVERLYLDPLVLRYEGVHWLCLPGLFTGNLFCPPPDMCVVLRVREYLSEAASTVQERSILQCAKEIMRYSTM